MSEVVQTSVPPRSADGASTLPQGEGGFGGDDPRAATEERRPRRGPSVEWLQVFDRPETRSLVAASLGLDFEDGIRPVEFAKLACAIDLGLCVARIVVADPIVDGAPQWRLAGKADSNAIGAFVLPVEFLPSWSATGSAISLSRIGLEEALISIGDLIAFPPSGGRPLSMTGACNLVGDFAPHDDDAAARVFATGRRWLDHFLEQCLDLAGELETNDVPLSARAPHLISTLIVQPKAIEWRPAMPECPIGRAVNEIRVIDSAGLGELIDAEMRKPLRKPKLPKVWRPAKKVSP